MAGTNLEVSILPSIDPTPSQEVERISCGRAHYDGSNPSCAEVSKGWWQLARCYRDSPITWWHVAHTAWRCIFLARWNGRRIEVILSVVSLASLGQWLIRCAVVDEKNDGCVKGAVLIGAFFTYMFSSTICLVNTWKLGVAFQSALTNIRIIKITLVTCIFALYLLASTDWANLRIGDIISIKMWHMPSWNLLFLPEFITNPDIASWRPAKHLQFYTLSCKPPRPPRAEAKTLN